MIVLPEIANFLMLVQTPSAVTVKFQRGVGSFDAQDIEAGYVKGAVEPWSRATISGPVGTQVRFLIGHEDIAEDFTDYRRTVGEFREQMSSALGAPVADVDVGSSAVAVTVAPASDARRKVTVGVIGDVAVRIGPEAQIAANRGGRVVPGQAYTYEGRGAVSAIREGAGAALCWVLEELY